MCEILIIHLFNIYLLTFKIYLMYEILNLNDNQELIDSWRNNFRPTNIQ